MRTRWIAACAALVLPAVGSAETIALRAARMLDVAAGRIVENALVVVEGERIAAVQPAEPPAEARLIDLGDATLLPGLIDVHTHLTLPQIAPGWEMLPVRETAVDDALRGAGNARKTLLAGFTTVRDLGSRGFTDVKLGQAIERGDVVGPRIVPAGHAIGITGGHCDVTGFAPGVLERSPAHGVADGADAVLQAVRYQIKHGAQAIKVCATAGVLSFEGPVGAQQMSVAELRAAVEEASRHGLRVAAHAHGTAGIIAAVEAGVASIEHGSVLSDEALRLMKERGTWLVPQAFIGEWLKPEDLPPLIRAKAQQLAPLVEESLRRAIGAGVRIAFGTDAAVIPHGMNARELGARVQRGMAPLEALRGATIYAAELLGVADRGQIEAGRLADLIAVPGNPLEDIRVTERALFVMKGGVVYKAPGAP